MLDNANEQLWGKTIVLNCSTNDIKLAELKKAGINVKKIIEVGRDTKGRDKQLYWLGMYRVLRLFPYFNDWEVFTFYVCNNEAEQGFISLKYAEYFPTFITTSKQISECIEKDFLLAVECNRVQYELDRLATQIPNFFNHNKIKASKNIQSQIAKLSSIKMFGDVESKKAIKSIEKLVMNGW